MARAMVLRGAIAGAVSGLLAFVFALVFAEPLIDAAIAYEEGRGEAESALTPPALQAPAGGEEEIVSRGLQSTLGLATGMVAMGVALGLLFAVAYTVLHGRVALRPRVLALLVAGAGFLTFYATPFVKYPANPPAVGNDETIGDRTGLFLVMIVGSLVILAVAVALQRRLAARWGTWNATLAAGIGYVVLAGVLMAVLPSPGELAVDPSTVGPQMTETPQPLRDATGAIVFPGFDADVLYAFRAYSLAVQALLWGVIGLVFGALVERATGSGAERPRETAPMAG